MKTGAIQNFKTEGINYFPRCVLDCLIFDKGVSDKLYFFHFWNLTEIVFRNDRDQNFDGEFTARYKVKPSFNWDSAVLEKNDLFVIKLKGKRIFKFGIGSKAEF